MVLPGIVVINRDNLDNAHRGLFGQQRPTSLSLQYPLSYIWQSNIIEVVTPKSSKNFVWGPGGGGTWAQRPVQQAQKEQRPWLAQVAATAPRA
jgi:hypothetical protein